MAALIMYSMDCLDTPLPSQPFSSIFCRSNEALSNTLINALNSFHIMGSTLRPTILISTSIIALKRSKLSLVLTNGIVAGSNIASIQSLYEYNDWTFASTVVMLVRPTVHPDITRRNSQWYPSSAGMSSIVTSPAFTKGFIKFTRS